MIDDPDVTVLLGDAVEQLELLDAESVQCIVTSPPFWGLRDYGTATWQGGDEACDHLGPPMRTKAALAASAHSTRGGAKHVDREPVPGDCPRCGAVRVDRQIGLEETPEQWCAALVAVFRACRRVLRADGVLWLEVGDTYSASPGQRKTTDVAGAKQQTSKGSVGAASSYDPACKPKDLVGAPWLLAFALRADGWFLRSDVIWARPNPMPESVTDRPTKAHSYVFLLTKSSRYFYDADAIREEDSGLAAGNGFKRPDRINFRNATGPDDAWTPGGGRNARTVWSIATQPTPFAHFATMPEALVQRCIAAGTSEHGCCPECGEPWRRVTEREVTSERKKPLLPNVTQNGDGRNGRDSESFGHTITSSTTGWEPSCDHDAEPRPCVVLDPFMGSGTTALVARKMGRRAVGIELNPEYLEIARERLSQQSLFA